MESVTILETFLFFSIEKIFSEEKPFENRPEGTRLIHVKNRKYIGLFMQVIKKILGSFHPN